MNFCLVSEILSFSTANFAAEGRWDREGTGKELGRQEISNPVQLDVPKADFHPLG